MVWGGYLCLLSGSIRLYGGNELAAEISVLAFSSDEAISNSEVTKVSNQCQKKIGADRSS